MRQKKIVISEPMQVYNLVARVNRDGIQKAAEALDCDPTTLTRWLNEQGFVMIRRWEDRKATEQKRMVQNG